MTITDLRVSFSSDIKTKLIFYDLIFDDTSLKLLSSGGLR